MNREEPDAEEYEPDEIDPEEPASWLARGEVTVPADAGAADWIDQQEIVDDDGFDFEPRD